MEYTVVVRLSITVLVEEVNQLINEGWMPYGSMLSSDEEYIQPMVRYPASTDYTSLKPSVDGTPATP